LEKSQKNKKKPQIPENKKQIDKTNEKKERRIRCPYDRHRTFLIVRERSTICASS
jgi:DNA-directed RNA polymerase subunit RPC12/RpoP